MRNDEIAWDVLAAHPWDRIVVSPGSGPPRARPRSRHRPGRARPARDPGARRLPRPPGARARQRRRASVRGRGDRPRPDQPRLSSRRRPLRRHRAGLSRGPLPLAGRRAGAAAAAGGGRVGRRRNADGDPRPRAARLGRAVSSRVDRHRARRAAHGELHRADAAGGAAAAGRRRAAAQHGRAGRPRAGPVQRRRANRAPRARRHARRRERLPRPCSATASTPSGWTPAASIPRCRASRSWAPRWASWAPRCATASAARSSTVTRGGPQPASPARRCLRTSAASSRGCTPRAPSCRSTSTAASSAISATS